MCRITSLFLVQRLKGSTSGDARDFNNIETRAVTKFFFPLQGKAPKEIYAILTETLGNMYHRMPPSKTESDAEVIAAAETGLDGLTEIFFFLSGLQKLEQRTKKCIELCGEYVE